MERKKKINNYTIMLDNVLGEGAFGKVYVGEQDTTKLKVAIKVLERKTIDKDKYMKNALFSEIDILKCLKSPNVVGFLDVMQSVNSYYIIQEFCNGGELRQLLKKRGRMPENEAIGMITQICNGFVELVKQGVMHRDLKPQNVLIHQGVLKLADFGFSKKGQLKKMAAQTLVGTPLYMSPQILKSLPYSSKCDIWGLGCIFFEMMVGRTPWIGNSSFQLLNNIEHMPLSFPVEISDVTRDFLRKCLGLNQRDRFSWDQLLNHPMFKGYFSNKQYENKYKAEMNCLRYTVIDRSIDLDSMFQSLNHTKNGFMNYASFQKLFVYIDPNINLQEIKYIFSKINQSNSGQISYSQFEDALNKFGIPMSLSNQPLTQEQKLGEIEQKDPVKFKQQVNVKIANVFNKLIKKLTDKNMTLYQLFDAYKITERGTINISEYDHIICSIDPKFSQHETKVAFSMFSKQGMQTVPLRDFTDYFTSVTGLVPTRALSRAQSTDSRNSVTVPVQNLYPNNQPLLHMNSHPMQYPNFGYGLPGVDINRRWY